MGIALGAAFCAIFFGAWLVSARLAILILVVLRTTIDAVGPEFPIIGEKLQFNTFELQEVSSIVLLLLELLTIIDLTFLKKITWPSYAKACFLFNILLFVGAARSVSDLGAYSECLRATTWTMLIVILPQLIRSERDIRTFVWAGCIAACVPVLGGIYSLVTGYRVGAYYGEMMGGLAGLKDIQGWHQSPPNLGVLLASLTAFPATMLLWAKRNPAVRVAMLGLLALIAYFVYRTYYRTGLLALLVFTISLALYLRPTKGKIIAIFVGLACLWFLMITTDIITIKKQDFDIVAMGGESSLWHRVFFWTLVWASWLSSNWSQKLLGHGTHSVKELTWGKSAHNDFFNILHDNGLLPLLCYLLFLGLIFWRFLRLRKHEAMPPATRQMVCVAMALFTSSMMVANTMRFMYSVSWMLYLAAFFGIVLAFDRFAREPA